MQGSVNVGSENAYKSLVTKHLRYAEQLSRNFFFTRSDPGIELEELRSAAYLGLCHAAQRYDQTREETFETFSYLRIRGEMFDLVRRKRVLTRANFPWLSTEEGERNAKPKRQFLPQSAAELASVLAVLEEVNVTMHIENSTETVDLSYNDQPSPESAVEAAYTQQYLKQMIARLPEREKVILELYYFHGWTFEDMRQHFAGMTRSWLSRLHHRALDRLRALIEAERFQCERKVAACA